MLLYAFKRTRKVNLYSPNIFQKEIYMSVDQYNATELNANGALFVTAS